MNYWLSRHESASPEGPFPLSTIETLFNQKVIGEDASVCLEGKKKWVPVQPVLRADWDRRHGVTKKRRERLVLKLVLALLAVAAVIVAEMIWKANYNHPLNVAAREAAAEQRQKEKLAREIAEADEWQQKQQLQSQRNSDKWGTWNAVAAVYENAGAQVVRDGSVNRMRVVVPSALVQQMSEYQLKLIAQAGYSRLGDWCTVTIEDEFGTRISKASWWGASVTK